MAHTTCILHSLSVSSCFFLGWMNVSKTSRTRNKIPTFLAFRLRIFRFSFRSAISDLRSIARSILGKLLGSSYKSLVLDQKSDNYGRPTILVGVSCGVCSLLIVCILVGTSSRICYRVRQSSARSRSSLDKCLDCRQRIHLDPHKASVALRARFSSMGIGCWRV
jgi:hypothetical protein